VLTKAELIVFITNALWIDDKDNKCDGHTLVSGLNKMSKDELKQLLRAIRYTKDELNT
jgi:hypothetical protein